MGMLANGKDIGPKGMHLRWMFPPALGIPKTTEIFRKATTANNITKFLFDKIQNNEPLKANELYHTISFSGFSASGLLGMPNAGGLRNANKNPLKQLVIKFPNYISNFKISLLHDTDTRVFAYRDKVPVEAQTAFKDNTGKMLNTVLSFENIDINSIAVELSFDVLLQFEYADITALMEAPEWVQIGSTHSAGDLTAYLNKCNANTDIFNYYLTKNSIQRTAAIAHYRIKAEELVGLYRFLSNLDNYNNATVFENPGENLANLRFKTQPGKPFNNIKPIGLISMAAQDPNLANILGLYFIDNKIPDVKGSYDYKIQCSYSGGKKVSGIVLNLGKEMYAAVPGILNVLAKDTEVRSWEYDNLIDNPTLVGNIGLKWDKPVIDTGNARQRFNEPVFFAVKRKPEFKPVPGTTNPLDKLVVVPENNFTDPLLNNFTDTKVKRLDADNYTYDVSPVTIFGLKGKTAGSNAINISEVIPVPPIALSIQEMKLAGQPLKQKLRFKFGAAQYFVAPHTKRFIVYSRPGSLIDKQELKYTIEMSNGKNYRRTGEGHKLFTLRIVNDGNYSGSLGLLSGDLNTFQNKPWHTAEFSLDKDKKLLPAAQIKKFSIQRFIGNNIIEIMVDTSEHPVYEISGEGYITLIKDTHSTSTPCNWNITNLAANLVPPKRLVLVEAKPVTADTVAGFEAVITKKIRISPVRDRVSGNTITPAFTELFFNRALLEQGIFDRGTVKIGTVIKQIIYQGGGVASSSATPDADMDTDAKKGRFARILVQGEFPAAAPDIKIILRPASLPVRDINNPLSGFFTLKFNTPAGGIPVGFGDVLLRIKQVLKIGEDGNRVKDHIAPVSLPTLSDFAATTGGVEVLVKIDKKINSFTPRPINHCAFFSQYEVDVSTVIAAQAIPANEATVNTFFALQSESDGTAEFKRSILSAPAQYYKANLAVPAAPGAPNPCVMPPPGEKAFLPPPDLKGYAVNCITWPALPNLRYEVYRALDATILVQHKNELLRGNRIAVNGFVIPTAMTLTLPVIISDGGGSGFLSAEFTTPSIAVNGEKAFVGSGLEISKTGKKNYYQVVAAKILSSNFTAGSPMVLRISLTLKPVNANNVIAISSAVNKLTLLPDYISITKNEAVLKLLANHPALEKAYSLVSIVPVRGNSFNDFVAARGNNMFFYKVRAVNAAEVKSAFSSAGIPVFQMDTTPPDQVQEFSACSIDNRAMLVWKKDPGTTIKTYKLIKETIQPGGGNVEKTELFIQDFELVPRPYFLSNANTILFNSPLVIAFPAALTLSSSTPTAATDIRVKNSITVKVIINPATIALISSVKYKISYTINLVLKKFVIRGIEFLEKRDAKFFFQIGLNGQVLTTEAAYTSFIDAQVETGQVIKYSLVPVKLVGPQPPIKIQGAPAVINAIEIKDFSKPAVIIDLVFLKTDNSISIAFDKTAKGKFIINQQAKLIQIKIERKIFGSSGFALCSVSEQRQASLSMPQKGWLNVNVSAGDIILIDQDRYASDATNVEYRISARSAEGVAITPITIIK